MTCIRAGHFRLSNIVFQEQGLGQNLGSSGDPRESEFRIISKNRGVGLPHLPLLFEKIQNLYIYAKSIKIE
jgi:hypothetical protein